MKTRILIVEDDKKTRLALVCLLEKEGYDVIAAADGNEGLRLIYAREYDIAIIDLTLPGISGRQLIVKLREFDTIVPVIVLTGDSEDVAQTDTAGYGADFFIQKPHRNTVLIAWIERLVSRNAEPNAHRLRFNQGELDTDHSTVIPDESDEFAIPWLQTRLFALMLRSRTRVLSYERLIKEVWGEEGAVQRNAVQKAVSRLNDALVSHELRPVTKDIRNYGYEFTGKDC